MVSNIERHASFLFQKTLYHIVGSVILMSCCRHLGGFCISSWISCSHEYASGECWKCPTICLALALSLCWDNNPSLTTSCSVCNTALVMDSRVNCVLYHVADIKPLKMMWTLVHGMCHWSSISFMAVEMESLLCDPWKFFACSIALWG